MITDSSDIDPVVEIRSLSRRFAARAALDDVNMTIPRGSVFGLVGANGAGKTTLIKHVLGLLRAQSGRVRVFGKNPVADPAGVLSRIGYMSEEHDLPGWMTVSELIRYTRAFFPNWDPEYAEELRDDFELDPQARIKELSKGQRARAALVTALAHRPELLVLDEPSAGLDPLVRRDILEAIIRAIADEGRTVLFSSHLLHEVERVSDHVTMIKHGRIVFSAALEDIKATHHFLTLHFPQARTGPPEMHGALTWSGTGHLWTAIYHGQPGDLQAAAASCGAQVLDQRMASLDEIFVARVGSRLPATDED